MKGGGGRGGLTSCPDRSCHCPCGSCTSSCSRPSGPACNTRTWLCNLLVDLNWSSQCSASFLHIQLFDTLKNLHILFLSKTKSWIISYGTLPTMRGLRRNRAVLWSLISFVVVIRAVTVTRAHNWEDKESWKWEQQMEAWSPPRRETKKMPRQTVKSLIEGNSWNKENLRQFLLRHHGPW